MKGTKNTNDLKVSILKVLEQQYSCAQEILTILDEQALKFEKRQFYPTLSNLQLKNYLCSHWIKNNNGENTKYYHITKNGYNYIHQ